MKRILILNLILFSFSLQAQTLRVATYRYASNDRIGNLKPVADHISQITGRPTEVKSYPTVQAFIEGIRNNEVDLAFINTFGYILLQVSGKAYPMFPAAAMVVPQGETDVYKTAFLVRNESELQSWNAIPLYAAKQRLALVAEGSTSGNLVPRLALTQLGIHDAGKNFDTVFYAGNHQLAVVCLIDGKSDIAAMGHDAYAKWTQQNPGAAGKIRQLYLSPEIPLGPALINKNLPQTTRDQLEKALLDLHQDAPAALQGLRDGWTEARKATHFERIRPNHYDPFLSQFGNSAAVASILQQFAN